jgi:hypothetical protein
MTIAEPTKAEAPSKREDAVCAVTLVLACVATFLLAQAIASGALMAFEAFGRLLN